MPTVRIKGTDRVINFPDEMDKESIAAELRRNLVGAGEVGLSMGGDFLGSALGGLAGIYTGLSGGGLDGAARAVDRVREDFAYEPRSDEGRQYMQTIGETMQPIADSMDTATSVLGQQFGIDPRSPEGQFFGELAPALAGSVPPLAGARMLPGRQYEMGEIDASGPGGSQRGSVGGVRENVLGEPDFQGSYLDQSPENRMLTKERYDELGLEGNRFSTTRADLTAADPRGIDFLGSARFDPVPAQGGPGYSDMFGMGWAAKNQAGANKLTKDEFLVPTAMQPDSHKSNATVSEVYTNALEQDIGNGFVSNQTIKEMEKDLSKQFPGIPKGGTPKEFNQWLKSVSFDKRAAVMNTLNKAKYEGKGLPDINRLLNQTLDPGAAGRLAGEPMTLIRNDPNREAIRLGQDGYPSHLSYDYGTRGNIEAEFPPGMNESDLFPERYGQYIDRFQQAGRANPEADAYYTFRTGVSGNPFGDGFRDLLPSQSDIQGTRGVNTRSFDAAVSALSDDWNVLEQGKSLAGSKDFLRSMETNEGGATLTPMTKSELDGMLKSGKAKVFQLGTGDKAQDSKFMVKRDSYKWADDSLPEEEWVLSSVLNNETGVKGVAAEAVLHKAMREGVTALDAFDVPGAYGLPKIYGKYGFEEKARVPFDKDIFMGDQKDFWVRNNVDKGSTYKQATKTQKKKADAFARKKMADAENFWRSQGWEESQGYPDMVIMRKERDDAENQEIEQIYRSALDRGRSSQGQGSFGAGTSGASQGQRDLSKRVLDEPTGSEGTQPRDVGATLSGSDSVLPSGRRSGVVETLRSGMAYPTLNRRLSGED